MTLAEALETTRIHRVAGLTNGRAAVITTRPFRGGLCDSLAMSTGNCRYGEAVRERGHAKTMSRTQLICISWWRWPCGWNRPGRDETLWA
jgi:hypothetical protein